MLIVEHDDRALYLFTERKPRLNGFAVSALCGRFIRYGHGDRAHGEVHPHQSENVTEALAELTVACPKAISKRAKKCLYLALGGCWKDDKQFWRLIRESCAIIRAELRKAEP